jgi:hypothetical protein
MCELWNSFPQLYNTFAGKKLNLASEILSSLPKFLLSAMLCLLIILPPAALLLYLLAAPVHAEINSTTGLIQVRFHRLARATVVIEHDVLLVQVNALWWKKTFDILDAFAQRREQKAPSVQKMRQQSTRSIPLKKVRGVLASFTIRQCRIMLDTGDVRANATLFPVFYWLHRTTGRNIAINFTQQNDLVLDIENSIARIVWAFITH